jgi:glycosyltransferase involved in cell wall biosynthesis
MGSLTRAFTPTNISKGVKLLRKKGIKAVLRKVKSKIDSPNRAYGRWYEQHRVNEADLAEQRRISRAWLEENCEQGKGTYTPLISILVPVYNPPEKFLTEMVKSVIAQTYPNWELCIADGGSTAEPADGEKNGKDRAGGIQMLLEEYAKKDPRIKYRKLEKNAGISENTNRAYEMAKGDYIGLLDHDDMLSPDCLYEVVTEINRSGADVIYTDEDKITADSDNHSDPQFKPDFSIDFLRTHNYITHFLVVKQNLLDSLCEDKACGSEKTLFKSEYDGAQDYDLVLRLAETAENIRHIPKILYHWRVSGVSTAGNPYAKSYADEAGLNALRAHIKRCGLNARAEHTDMNAIYRVSYLVTETPSLPLVSVVIPNKDHIQDLDKCIKSVMEKSTYKKLEFIIVENNSTEKKTYAYYKNLKSTYDNVKVVRWNRDKKNEAPSGEASQCGETQNFNFSAINNYGVSFAEGEYLLFLNNDTEIISGDAIERLLGIAMRDDVGAVGAKLLFKDNSVQHAGLIIGPGGFAGPVFTGLRNDDLGYMLRPVTDGNYSAVTAACMMVKKSVFKQAGGYDEKLAVALNDVDLCLKIRQKDKLIVYCAESLWHHYESKSRGYEENPEKRERFEKEIAYFKSKWQDVIDAGDPYYNPNLSLETPFMLD